VTFERALSSFIQCFPYYYIVGLAAALIGMTEMAKVKSPTVCMLQIESSKIIF